MGRLIGYFSSRPTHGCSPHDHTPNTTFRHLPPNSARFIYLRAAVHRRGQRPPKGSGTNMTVEATRLTPKHARKHETHPPRVKQKEFRLDSNDCGFICAGVNFIGGYK